MKINSNEINKNSLRIILLSSRLAVGSCLGAVFYFSSVPFQVNESEPKRYCYKSLFGVVGQGIIYRI